MTQTKDDMPTEYQDPDKLTEAMKAGLARLYADEDIRAYMVHMVNVYNHNVLASMRKNQPEMARDYTSKFDTMKKLHDNAKLMFTNAEKLRSMTLSEQVANKEHGTTNQVKVEEGGQQEHKD